MTDTSLQQDIMALVDAFKTKLTDAEYKNVADMLMRTHKSDKTWYYLTLLTPKLSVTGRMHCECDDYDEDHRVEYNYEHTTIPVNITRNCYDVLMKVKKGNVKLFFQHFRIRITTSARDINKAEKELQSIKHLDKMIKDSVIAMRKELGIKSGYKIPLSLDCVYLYVLDLKKI
jgi:hypothetical protein